MIEGVILAPLRIIPDDRGQVMHMMRSDSPEFRGFGEVYFSIVRPGAIKAWKRHQRMTLNIAVPVGRIRFVLYDDRAESRTRGKVQEIILGERDYRRLTVPPMIWVWFRGEGEGLNLLCNCADILHDPNEGDSLPHDDGAIPYSWEDNGRP